MGIVAQHVVQQSVLVSLALCLGPTEFPLLDNPEDPSRRCHLGQGHLCSIWVLSGSIWGSHLGPWGPFDGSVVEPHPRRRVFGATPALRRFDVAARMSRRMKEKELGRLGTQPDVTLLVTSQ